MILRISKKLNMINLKGVLDILLIAKEINICTLIKYKLFTQTFI